MSKKSPSAGHDSESHSTFFRQSGWLVVATVSGGVFMVATQMVASRWMTTAEYVVFFALLRVFLLMGIPSMGLQTVFAHQTAGAVTEDATHHLSSSLRTVLRGAFFLWLVMAGAAWFWQGPLVDQLKITNPAALWATVVIGLLSLWLPALKGVLQGRQNFLGLGWVIILDGVGRFLFVAVILYLGGQAAGGMTGALIGQVLALMVGGYLIWDVLAGRGDGFRWKPWLRRVVPLTLGPGCILLLSNADVVFVQVVFGKDQAKLYMPAAMIGVAMINFTMPLVAVMFPKVARSVALTRGTRAVEWALGATVLLGAGAALACTLLPKLPLQVIYLGNPDYVQAAPLVPWFAWALVPLIVGNVLVGNLLARERFGVVIWVVGIAGIYGLSLWSLRDYLVTLEAFRAFKTILGLMGGANLLLCVVAILFTLRERSLVMETP